jgi:hypothetical protein
MNDPHHNLKSNLIKIYKIDMNDRKSTIKTKLGGSIGKSEISLNQNEDKVVNYETND